jgi:hypothetical protein
MPIFDQNLITADDLKQIEDVLYTPREEEMPARRLLNINRSYESFAREIGFDYYQREGSAKILARGASANDVPFVGEKGGRCTQAVYDIASGIRYTKAELDAMAAKRRLGKGPAIQIDTLKIEAARRFILEEENKATFLGASGLSSGGTNYNIKGLLDSSFYGTDLGTKENVATTTANPKSVSTNADKRLWVNKSTQEILDDLFTGMSTVENKGLFKARALVLAPASFNILRKPYSQYALQTILTWLNSEGLYFDTIIPTRAMASTYNGDTVNYFMIIDNDPEIAELAITYDINLGNPIYDILGTSEMAVTEGFGGVMLRHPAAVYVGKGI